ncbi:MAG: ATP-grasp domain-containing protein [Acidobacteria bacterium]|nr:ATP-grasp domain-containing protein [Acidobacteriota bacterium]
MRLLADTGFPVDLAFVSLPPEHWSRFAKVRLRANTSDRLLEQCESLLEQSSVYQMVVLADGYTIDTVSLQPERFPRCAKWLGIRPDLLPTLSSKVLFMEAARAHGLSQPEFEIVDNLADAVEAAKRIGFPLVVKEAMGAAGSGVSSCQDLFHLQRVMNSRIVDGPVMLQEFADGLLGCTAVLYSKGVPVRSVSCGIADPWPDPFSPASTFLPVTTEHIAELLQGLGKMTGFDGMAGIDWIRRPQSSEPLLIDFNPRPIQASYLGNTHGEFSKALRAKMMSAEIPQELWGTTTIQRKASLFTNHLQWSCGNRNIRGAWKSLVSAPWDDPLLVAAQLLQVGINLPSFQHMKRFFALSGTRETLEDDQAI